MSGPGAGGLSDPTSRPALDAGAAIDEGLGASTPLRIALLSPPMLAVPPVTYAGTERVVAALAAGLHARGHHVTLFAPGDSDVDVELVPTVKRSLWSTGYRGPVDNFIDLTIAMAWRHHHEFDIIHSHLETGGFLFARYCPAPVISTLHGRLDHSGIPELLDEFTDIPLVAISRNQRRWSPRANWVATIHHGLPLEQLPFSDRPGKYLAFVGRITPEKGVADAIELARRTGLPLRMAAKVYDPHEVEHFRDVVQPAIDDGTVEFLGELGQNARDALYTGALATVMLGAWPEPFGLVAIESMATGTPIIARRAGGLMETVDHGVTGFLVDDLTEAQLAVRNVGRLRRHAVRQRVIERFLPARMAAEYETAYRKLLASRAAVRAGSTVDPPTPLDPAVLTATPARSRPRTRGGARPPAVLTALPVGEPPPDVDAADLSDDSVSSASGSGSAR